MSIKYECIDTLKGHTNRITSIISLPDGTLVSASADTTIKVWVFDQNSNKFNCTRTISDNTEVIWNLLYLSNGTFVSASHQEIRIYDPSQDFLCVNFSKDFQTTVHALLELPDGKLVCGIDFGEIFICDIQNNKITIMQTLVGHEFLINCLLLLPDGKMLSGSYFCIRIWDSKDNFNCVKIITEEVLNVFKLILLPDGKVASASNQYIKVWDPSDDFKCVKAISAHNSRIQSIIYLEEGFIVSSSWDKTVKLWEAETLTNISTFKDHTDFVNVVGKIKNGFASGSHDQTIKIFA
jgi:WD40 repeat protein